MEEISAQTHTHGEIQAHIWGDGALLKGFPGAVAHLNAAGTFFTIGAKRHSQVDQIALQGLEAGGREGGLVMQRARLDDRA